RAAPRRGSKCCQSSNTQRSDPNGSRRSYLPSKRISNGVRKMKETSLDNVRNLEAGVTEAGAALGERAQAATAATATLAGQAQKIAQDAAAATATAAGRA